ncbi:MAG: hypothetical protein ACFFC0_00450, partial [Promethearchaeota archaeon]
SVLLLPGVATSWTPKVSLVSAAPSHLFLHHGDFLVPTAGAYNLSHCYGLQPALNSSQYLVYWVVLARDAVHVTIFLTDSLIVGAVRRLRPSTVVILWIHS